MKVAITGAGGFIGSNLVAHLVERPSFEVIAVDKIFRYSKYGSVSYIEDCYTSNRALREMKVCDVIVHLAASGNVKKCQQDSRSHFENDVANFEFLLKSLADHCHRVPKIIFSSTAGALFSQQHAIDDQATPRPASEYGLFKYFNEQLLTNYAHWYGFDYTILRFSNIYGMNGWHKENLIPNLIHNSIVKIFGDGEQVRTFFFVDDLVRVITVCILDKGQYNNLTVGTKECASVNHVIQLCRSNGKIYDEIIYKPARGGEVRSVTIHSTKFENFVMDNGIDITVLSDGIASLLCERV